MSVNLFKNNEDGADGFSKAVKAFLQDHDGLECSWSGTWKKYLAEPKITIWQPTLRTCGYVVYMRGYHREDQINICFHRDPGGETLLIKRWLQVTDTAPNINNCGEGFNTAGWIDIDWPRAADAAAWIYEELERFWKGECKI